MRSNSSSWSRSQVEPGTFRRAASEVAHAELFGSNCKVGRRSGVKIPRRLTGERMDKGDLLEGINRLGTGPWRFATIIAATER